jgi:hypothetical protein
MPMATCSALFICVGDRFRFRWWIWLLIELSVVKATMMPIRLAAAPAYMSCTALVIDCGTGGRSTGSGIWVPPG